MSRPVVLSVLWPKNYPLLLALAQGAQVDIAAPASLVPAQVADALGNVGARFIPIIGTEYAHYTAAAAPEAAARSSRICAALPELVGTPAAATQETTSQTVALVQESLPASLRDSMALIDELDALASREHVAGVLVNETDLAMGRIVALWAKDRNIPSFLLSHGGNIGTAYTVTRCMLADYLLVFGTRGRETYLDIGIPADRMIVTGNPAWDQYPAVIAARPQYRADVYSRLQLRENEPVIVFATIWNTRLTAIHDAQIFQNTVRSFLRGCKRLREMGTAFNVVFKDRPSNSAFGKDEIARIAAEEDFTDYAYGIGDMEVYVAAADLLVSFDSNVFVEAMIAALPCINLWTPSTWLVGPGYGSGDGVPMVQAADTEGLAGLMRAALTDAEFRASLLTKMQAALPRFHLAMDGASTARCVQAIAQRLKPVFQKHVPAQNGAAGKQKLATLTGLMHHRPRRVLEIGSDGEFERELKAGNPGLEAVVLTLKQFTVEHLLKNVEPASIDTVFLTHALEDSREPRSVLSRLLPYVTPDAQVLTRVPNVRNLWLITELLSGRWDPAVDDLLDPRHLRFFALKNLLELFNETGYEIERVEHVPDSRVPEIVFPPSGIMNVDSDAVTLRGLLAHDVLELRARDFLISATPKLAALKTV